MSRSPRVTAETVRSAIDQIVEDGRRPTIRAIREVLGGGSPNSIQPFFAAWKASRPAGVNNLDEPAQGALAQLSGVIRKVLQAEIARACAPLQARVNELERDLAVERRELSRWRGIAAEAERMRDQERGNRIRAEREAAAFAERLSQKSGRPAKKKP